MQRVMIIASHPDDEVLGCGGLISKLKKKRVLIFLFYFWEKVQLAVTMM